MCDKLSDYALLQDTSVIAKTTQTIIGAEINVRSYEFITLHFVYTKGDETGLVITPSFLDTSGGTAYPIGLWTPTANVNAWAAQTYKMTATTTAYITLDVRGLAYVKFTQGGSNNDGTPTGTLKASYVLK